MLGRQQEYRLPIGNLTQIAREKAEYYSVDENKAV